MEPTARPVVVPTPGGVSETVFRCASYQPATCKCPGGTVYYGRRFPKGKTSGRKATYEELLQDNYHKHTMGSSESAVPCANSFFRTDPLMGQKKQCFCAQLDPTPQPVPKPTPEPTRKLSETVFRCASYQPATCKCPGGTVYYGRRFPKGQTSGRKATYEELIMDNHYKYIMMGNEDSIDCANYAFKTDPLKGEKKQCFCKQLK
uniref:Uncharacterized protein n=1 Tax=Lotharella globosa TaxID=91324 RepID=A0A7S3YMB1_9EUKA